MIFKVTCKLGYKIMLRKERYLYMSIKHPEVKSRIKEMKEILQNPEIVRESINDPKVLLYYKKFNKTYLVLVVKLLNRDGFIITAYEAAIIKRGNTIWPK
jgi:hypothetical protein